MKATLPNSVFWGGRLWPPGEHDIPEALAVLLKLKPQPAVKVSAALQLINAATGSSELTPLPGVGKGAARELLRNRPDQGYTHMAQVETLNPKLSTHPYSLEWAVLTDWQGDDE